MPNLFHFTITRWIDGLQCLPKGKRRKAVQDSFEQSLHEDLGGRVLDLDTFATNEAALIAARLRSKGRPVEIRDVLIAGITIARRGTLATRNKTHFVDTEIRLVDPWNAGPN